MRDTLTFTIDPKDAKDFDDVSFKKIGNYEIGIHIADVSYYLEEGTILDMKVSTCYLCVFSR
jgi:ribonuclease R